MRKIHIKDVAQLEAAISSLPSDSLYRGQNKDYRDADNNISISTSMSRQKCVPPLTLKWSYYAALSLRATLGMPDANFNLHLPQAVLQHYGWRSFFIDASSSSFVSAWFAAQEFSENQVINACEDCFENYIHAVQKEARYTPASGDCFFYAISKNKLSQYGVDAHNLTDFTANECRPRFHAQEAWVLGPLSDKLPHETVIAVIYGPADVFLTYAAKNGYVSISDLFPSPNEDPIYEKLLSVPWTAASAKQNERIFFRGLTIPEYYDSFIKFHPQNTAFVRSYWIANQEDLTDTPIDGSTFYLVPETAFYGHPMTKALAMPKVQRLLQQNRTVVVESEGLLRHPEFAETSSYMKGVVLTQIDDKIISIFELEAHHQGTQFNGWALTEGWFYHITASGHWTRIHHTDDCPCDNELRHNLHLWIINRFEDLLRENEFVQHTTNIFKHSTITICDE